jgi:hypothetical protein
MIIFSDIEEVFFFVGSESYGLHTAWISIKTFPWKKLSWAGPTLKQISRPGQSFLTQMAR